MTPPLRICTIWVIVLLAGGCGFQPRGQNATRLRLPDPVFIVGIRPYHELHKDIAQALMLAGATIAHSVDNALVLRIDQHRSERRVLSVDRRNKAVEYELEESFRFGLKGPNGRVLVRPQRLRSLRILLNPEVEVLGRNREQDLLRSDMRQELARRVVERLRAQTQ